jgi:hypothetical protein
MTDLAKYVVALEAQSAKYTAELEKANRRLESFDKRNKKSLDVIKGAFVALGAVVSVRMFSGFIKDQINAADESVKLSQKLGVATETLQGLALGADLAGAGAAGLQTGLIRLNRSVSDAAQGLATQKRAFDDLRVSVFNTDGSLRGTEPILRDIADAFAAMEDGVRKTARAQELFGRSGADLIPLLNEGSQGIDKMIDRAQRLGIVWSHDAAKAAEEFNDNLTLLSAVGRGFSSTIAQEMLPAMNAITAAMITFSEQSELSSRLGSAFAVVLKSIAHVAIGLGYGMVGLADRLAGVVAALAALGTDGVDAFNSVIADLDRSQSDLERNMQDSFKSLWEGASESAEKSLTEMRALAKAAFGEIATANQTDAIEKQIAALEAQAHVFGMTSAEASLYKLSLAGANAEQLELAHGALNLIQALEKEADIEKQLSALERQAAVFGMSAAEAGIYTLRLEGANAAQIEMAQGSLNLIAALKAQTEEIELAAKVTQRFETELQQTQREFAEVKALFDKGLVSPQTFQQAMDELLKPIKVTAKKLKEVVSDAEKGWARIGENMGRSLQDTLADAFLGIETSFGDMLKRMAAQAAANQLLNVLGASLGGTAGAVAGFLGFGGARAEGGPVSAGKSYLVGERGPELFQPNISGMITPNSGGVTITIGTINADDAIGVRRAVEEGVSQAISASAANTVGMIRKQYRPSIA